VFAIAVRQYFVFFHLEKMNVAEAVPAWIFPIYPLLVVGPMAGAMIPSQTVESGWNMWVGAVMFQGVAWIVALMMYAIYVQRLMSSTLPDPPVRPGMYVSVGPAGTYLSRFFPSYST
jgi:tellurite resistance protein TehA-like permease